MHNFKHGFHAAAVSHATDYTEPLWPPPRSKPVCMQVLRNGNNFATLRLSLDRIAIRKPFSFDREKFGLRVSATAAATFDGECQPRQSTGYPASGCTLIHRVGPA